MSFVLSRLLPRAPRPAPRGFTLLEVLLSVGVMSAGVLTVVVLYSLGFRETRQSREDIASAAYADAVMAPLVNVISSTNLKWSVFKDIGNFPGDDGWGEYYHQTGNKAGQVISSPEATAQSAFSSALAAYRGASAGAGSANVSGGYPTAAASGLKAGLVVMHEENASVVKIGFRAAQNPKMLMAAPLYYTEVRFQGLGDR